MAITTTLNKVENEIWEHDFNTLLEGLGKTQPDDEPLDMLKILDLCGLETCLMCQRAFPVENKKDFLLLNIHFAQEAYHLMNPISKKYFEIGEGYVEGCVTDTELCEAKLSLAEYNNKYKKHKDDVAAVSIIAQCVLNGSLFDTAYWVSHTLANHAKCLNPSVKKDVHFEAYMKSHEKQESLLRHLLSGSSHKVWKK